MTFLIVLLIPIIISGGAFFLLKETVTWKEFLLQLVLGAAACGVAWQTAKWGALQDTEHLNGRVTAKVNGTQKCCHCTDVCVARNKKGDCTKSKEKCDHSRDYYWDLETSVGKIPIENCRGLDIAPGVWVEAKIGEPASVAHHYTNYLLADPDSLMVHAEIERHAQQVPDYPSIYSKYKVDHVLGDVPASSALQQSLREMNADLGAPNQVDITLLLTSIQDPTYAQAVEAKWLYGPKNSFTIVAGVNQQTVTWVRVVTFSKVERLKVEVRDSLQGLSIDDPRFIATIREKVGSEFRRTKMADFEYLASTASPKGGYLALIILFELILSTGLAYWAHVKDIFGDERRRKFLYY